MSRRADNFNALGLAKLYLFHSKRIIMGFSLGISLISIFV